MKHALILLATVVAVYGVDPERCAVAPLCEGRMLEVSHQKQFERHGKVSYDADNQRIRILEEVSVGSKRDYYDDLALYKTEKYYELNLKTRKCTVSPLTRAFRPYHVPDFAKFLGAFYIGSSAPNEGVLVNAWSGEHPGHAGRYFGIWTDTGCLPVYDFFSSNATGFLQTSFYDMTIGIQNPNVFIPASECEAES